ncbi:MAG: mandelate racemase/muconate lactonizing enzyme family protein [Granulosicoccus sp.]
MRIRSLDFMHLAIPFKGEFEHGKKARHTGDTILVKLYTDAGTTGWGEILARSYVTGETTSNIMGDDGEALATAIVGQRFNDQTALAAWLSRGLHDWQNQLAAFGGIELALWQCLEQEHNVDMESLIGPRRQHALGCCVTVGFDATLDSLRARAIDARLKRATVVKLKVGLGTAEDSERLRTLSSHFKHQMPLRIDGNGTFNLTDAIALLQACHDLPVQSFEQPLASSSSDLDNLLKELHEVTGIPLMADECVCSIEQAERWADSGAYQIFNIRLGKHGGLLGSRHVRDCALNKGIGVVAGSMVGETGLLTQASTLFASRSDSLPYVEGLGQNQSWLTTDPVERIGDVTDTLGSFRFRFDACQPLMQSSRNFQ